MNLLDWLQAAESKRLMTIPVIFAQKETTLNLGPTSAEAYLRFIARPGDVSWQDY